jgi:hypothetical protein
MSFITLVGNFVRRQHVNIPSKIIRIVFSSSFLCGILQVDEEIRKAFQLWAAVTPLRFQRIQSTRSPVHIEIRYIEINYRKQYIKNTNPPIQSTINLLKDTRAQGSGERKRIKNTRKKQTNFKSQTDPKILKGHHSVYSTH